jgi:hypothetical protein
MNSNIPSWAAFGFRFFFARLFGKGARNTRRHEAQLRAMSTRELSDLGIGASQIPSVLAGSGDDYSASSRSKNER